MLLDNLMDNYRVRVERALDQCLPPATVRPAHLHEAMRYAVLEGGKRVRPILVYATGAALGVGLQALDGPACAVELIHAYSLVHDDLPAMDNDDLRRGKPTCHKVFGEAEAILAGDALHALAFHTLAYDPSMEADAALRLKMVETLAAASGSRGMVGGQAMDLAAVGLHMDLAELEIMHIHKTGALIRASVVLGALSKTGIESELLSKLDHYAKCIGLAFQICDDVLDVEGDTVTLGKTAGADLALNKPTYPALVGLSRAKQMAQDLHEEALLSLAPLGEAATPLRALANYLVGRKN